MKEGLDMNDCIFCRIVSKEIPATIYYENDKVMVIKDIHPAAPVHVLILSKEHIPSIEAITPANQNILAEIAFAAQKMSKLLAISEDGYRLICNYGVNGGQTIPHLHFHMIGGKKLGPKIL
jgi:histidine triad (HIT) family protein